jgi:hypothetical protein
MTTLTTLFMTALLAVPAPDAKDDGPPLEPTGPAPRLLFVKADADGKVLFTVRRAGGVNAAAGARTAVVTTRVELKDVKDLVITSPNGTKIELADAQKKLAAGAYVVLPSDGKAISTGYLRMFRPDVVVLTSPDIVPIAYASGIGGVRINGGGAALPVIPPANKVPAPGN